jgi:hypothetical protein
VVTVVVVSISCPYICLWRWCTYGCIFTGWQKVIVWSLARLESDVVYFVWAKE